MKHLKIYLFLDLFLFCIMAVFFLLSLVLSISAATDLLRTTNILPFSACTLPAYCPPSTMSKHTTSQRSLPISRRNMSHTWLCLLQLFSPLRKIQLIVLQIAGTCYSLPLQLNPNSIMDVSILHLLGLCNQPQRFLSPFKGFWLTYACCDN